MTSSRGRNADGHPALAGAYSIADAAQLLGVPVSTVRAWVRGRPYRTSSGVRTASPVVRIDGSRRPELSFRNLVELHVLASIRRRHRISLPNVRAAVRYLQRAMGDAHPLANRRMLTDGKDLLVREVGKLLNATRQGQLEMEAIVGRFLERVEHDDAGLPVRLFPMTQDPGDPADRPIVVDPRVAFGRACLTSCGAPTAEIAERFHAGESADSLADDFRTTREAIEAALRFDTQRAA